MSFARDRKYRHLDTAHLEHLLARCAPDTGRIVVTDGLFSMLGSLAPLPEIVDLAQKHGAALLCITEKDGRRPSLGSLVSLRAEAVRTERAGDRFRCEVHVLKDKRRGPGWKHAEVCRGPDGLC